MPQLTIKVIDFFYPLFRRFMPLQTFRYAACGGGNTLLGLISFYIFHEFVFKGREFDFGFYAMKAHTSALLVSFCITFTVGFLLMRYVVFIDSNLKGRIQLFRYFLSFLFNLFLNYLLLKLFVEKLKWNANAAQLVATCVCICISYISQKHFSFRVKNVSEEKEATL